MDRQGLYRSFLVFCFVLLSATNSFGDNEDEASQVPPEEHDYTISLSLEQLEEAILAGAVGDISLKNVVAHLGFTDTDYLSQGVLDHRLYLDIGERDKEALHIVLLTDKGIGPALMRQAANQHFIDHRKGTRHGRYLVITSKEWVERNPTFHNKVLGRADLLMVLDESSKLTPVDAMTRVLAKMAEQDKSSVEFLLKEGGPEAFEMLATVGMFHRLGKVNQRLQVIADVNFLPKGIAPNDNFLAATSLINLPRQLRSEFLEGLDVRYRYHEEDAIADAADPVGVQETNFIELERGDDRLFRLASNYKEGAIFDNIVAVASHKTVFEDNGALKIIAEYQAGNLNLWVIPQSGSVHRDIKEKKFRLTFHNPKGEFFGEKWVNNMDEVVLSGRSNWRTVAYHLKLNVSDVTEKYLAIAPDAQTISFGVSVTDGRLFANTGLPSVAEQSSTHKMIFPLVANLKPFNKVQFNLRWKYAQLRAAQWHLQRLTPENLQNGLVSLRTPLVSQGIQFYPDIETAIRMYTGFVEQVSWDIDKMESGGRSPNIDGCEGGFSN